ncbi:MAG TPA: TRIC cation channel family protein [Tepidiformaceae bacterium]
MDFELGDVVRLFDRIGIVAFALSGVEVGVRRRLDVFGLLVMGVVAATGGGLIRDVILVRRPFVVDHADYLLWAAGSASVAILVVSTNRRLPRALIAVADALGLGAFAVAGALAAIGAGLSLPAVVLLAIVTATGGGVVRDLLADRVPLVLRSEVNATAAAIGGLVVWLLEPVSLEFAALAGLGTTALVRVATLALDVNLPVPGRHRQGRQRKLL